MSETEVLIKGILEVMDTMNRIGSLLLRVYFIILTLDHAMFISVFNNLSHTWYFLCPRWLA